MKMEWMAGTRFDSARQINTAARHGHGFVVRAHVLDGSKASADQLNIALQNACMAFDLNDLNEFFDLPDDLTIAKHIHEQLKSVLKTDVEIHLQSAVDIGVSVRHDGTDVWLSGEFSAAHFLPNVPEGHQCGRLHGHGFKVRLLADAGENAAQSLAALRFAWQGLFEQLNHRHLNHIEGLANPTSENLTEWLWQYLQNSPNVSIQAVEVFETASAGSRRDASGFTIWKDVRFEAAKPFDDQGRYTGHSYLARLFLHGDKPDATAGWLRDFADVKAIFKPFYAQLDHFALDAISDLHGFDAVHVAAWIAAQLRTDLPELSRVEVFENESSGAAVVLNGANHVHG